MKFSKKILVSTLAVGLFTGGIGGVYAGTIIERYKTPRGNIATVEQENVHKNRIGITVNGKELKNQTWYANGVTYAPIREVATILGASVNYNSTTQSADIVTGLELLNLLGLEIGVPYYLYYKEKVLEGPFTITYFDPRTNEFKGTLVHYGNTVKREIEGKISETKLRFTLVDSPKRAFEFDYNGGTKEFKGGENGFPPDWTIFLN